MNFQNQNFSYGYSFPENNQNYVYFQNLFSQNTAFFPSIPMNSLPIYCPQMNTSFQNVQQSLSPSCQSPTTKNQESFKQVSRNSKSTTLRQFMKFIKKDDSSLFELQRMGQMKISVKQFREELIALERSNSKYIRVNQFAQICRSEEKRDFAKILRILILRFIRLEHHLITIGTKKSSGQKRRYLVAARELNTKLFKKNL